MADKVTNTNIIGVGLEYTKQADGSQKTVYLKMTNPRTDLTEATIKEKVNIFIGGNEPIFLTPDGQHFDTETAITTAYTETVQRTDFDIGVSN